MAVVGLNQKFPFIKILPSSYNTTNMPSAAERMAQLEQLIAECRRLEDERAQREAEQLAELVELEEEEKC